MFLTRKHFLRFVFMKPAGDDGGGGGGGAAPAPAPVAEAAPPAAAPAPVAAPSPAPAAAPADPFSSLRTQLESLGSKEAAGAPDAAALAAQTRDPLGRWATAAQKAAGAVTPPAPAPAAAAPATPEPTAAPAPAAKPGEIDLTPPEGMNPRSQERWQQLTERVKQAGQFENQAREASQALDSVRQLVTNAGLAPQEFSDMLETARLAKSTNPQDAQAAMQRLDAIRADLAQRFGLQAPGVDALAAHPDLKAKVEGMLLTHEDALEIARLRAGNQNAEQITAAQREQQQYQQTVNNAAASMERTLKAREGTPGHQQKLDYIGQHFKNPQNLQRFVQTYQPHQWEHVLSTMYDLYQPPVAAPLAAPTVVPAAPVVPQPLRPSPMRPGAQVQTTPLTAMDAVQSAFASLGR
jgi:hypothetical protein